MVDASSSFRLPDLVHPATPGDTHAFYGDCSSQRFLLPSIKARILPSAEQIQLQEKLAQAAESGNAESLQLVFMEEDPAVNVNYTLPGSGMTALHYASSRGHLPIVQLLVDQCGALVDIPDREGETALLKAAYNGHFSVVQCLLQRRTNVHHRDKDGWTALHNACARGHARIVQLLIELGGADVNCKSVSGHTPLSIAVYVNAASKGLIEIVEYLLLCENTDPLLKNVHGETAYDAAAANLSATVCEMLEEAEREWWTRPHGEATSYTGAYDLLALHGTVLVLLHENQRAAQAFQLFSSAPLKYSSTALARADKRAPWTRPPSHHPCTQEQVHVPDSNWFWLTEWEMDMQNPRGSEEGWEYARGFDDLYWSNKAVSTKYGVRRRRWIRVMKRRVEFEGIQPTGGKNAMQNGKEKILNIKSDKRATLIRVDHLEPVHDDDDDERVSNLLPTYTPMHPPRDKNNGGSMRLRGGGDGAVLRLRGGGPGDDEQDTISGGNLPSFATTSTVKDPIFLPMGQDAPSASTKAIRLPQSLEYSSSYSSEYSEEMEPTNHSSSSLAYASHARSEPDQTLSASIEIPRRASSTEHAASFPPARHRPISRVPTRTETPLVLEEEHRMLQEVQRTLSNLQTHDVPDQVESMLNTLTQSSTWEADEDAPTCRRCQRRFTLWLRRHHCRRCGRVYCDRCSSQRALLPPHPGDDSAFRPLSISGLPSLALASLFTPLIMQRVCENCHQLISHAQASTSQQQRRRNSESSIMLDCPVCGKHMEGAGDRHSQESHVRECIEQATTGGMPSQGTRYVVYKLEVTSALINQECPICFDEFHMDDAVARLSCLCTYHRVCIDRWLVRGHGCPVHQV